MSTESRREFEPVTSRGLEEYLRSLNLSLDDLKNKRVLDVGSGSGRFAAEARALGIDNIYSLDPALRSDHLQREAKQMGVASKAIIAKAEAMPFQSESFDLVLNNFSLPMWAESSDEMRHAFEEELRVLRPGGEMRIAPVIVLDGNINAHFTPVNDADTEAFSKTWQTLIEEWQANPALEIKTVENPEIKRTMLIIKKRQMPGTGRLTRLEVL